jgi:uncharacterized protein (DUF2147 family)
MTFAWYGQFRFPAVPLAIVIPVSWAIAFFEYCFAVPANRLGHTVWSGGAAEDDAGDHHAHRFRNLLGHVSRRGHPPESHRRLLLPGWRRLLLLRQMDLSVCETFRAPRTFSLKCIFLTVLIATVRIGIPDANADRNKKQLPGHSSDPVRFRRTGGARGPCDRAPRRRLLEGRVAIQFFECNDMVCGRVIWVKESLDAQGLLKKDKYNPDPALRGRQVCGPTIIWNLHPVDTNHWEDGWFYNPDDGATYRVKLEIRSADVISARIYEGVSMLGKTKTLARVPIGISQGWC